MDSLPNICNSTMYDYTEEQLTKMRLFKDHPDGLLLFSFVCCVFYMLIGIPGNLITIIALARCKKIQNATTVFIMNLACSDLMFCCFNLPIISTTYWQRHWPFGMTVCRMFPMAGFGLAAVSLFTVLAIMVNRYVLIAHPSLYTKMYKSRYTVAIVACTWILPFGLLIPTWLEKWGRFGMDPVIGTCSILPDCRNRSPKKFLIGTVIIPCLLVLICYLRIFCIARKSANRSYSTRRHKRYQRKLEVSTIVSIARGSVANEKFSDSGVETGQTALSQNILHPCFHDEPTLCTGDNLDEHSINSHANAKIETQLGNNSPKHFRLSLAVLNHVRKPITFFQPSRKDKKLLQIIMTIIVSFWVCYLPITIIKLFCDFSPVARVLGNLLVYLPSCIHPVIYVVMSREYRQVYKSLFLWDDAPNISRTMDSKNSIGQRISEVRVQEFQNHKLTAV